MTPRNAAEIALGVAGIYFILGYVPGVIVTFAAAFQDVVPLTWLQWVGFMQAFVMLAAGLVLFGLRGQLAVALTRHMDASPSETAAPGVHAAAVSVLGLYFFVIGLGSLLSIAAGVLEPVPFSRTTSAKQFIPPAVQTVFGAGLFLGARGIVRVWTTLRTAGRPHDGDGATRRV